MQTVLQCIDVMASAQSETRRQVFGCREFSDADGAPGTLEAEYGRRRIDATHGWTRGAQGPNHPTRTAGVQDPIPTGQQLTAGSTAPADSPDW